MPDNDQEVFEQLQADPETPREIDLLTYAIFAQEKQQWLELFEKKNNRKAKQAEIDKWISELTDWRFSQMREEAVQFFDTAARAYLSEEIDVAKKEVREETIIREVRAAGGFWRQLAMQMITAVLAPLLIGLIIAAAILYDKNTPRITDITDRINKPAPETSVKPTQ